ncbi:MAG: hypothetical protein ACREJR_00060 [Candidatus Rokuibacteriota bacterium]
MSEWPAQAADAVEQFVTTVRERTVTPARAVAKGLVYGLLTVILVGTAATLAVIAIFRLLTYIPGGAWVAYLILGGIFVAAGLFCWLRRSARTPRQD